jgi:hypothetical protein
MIRGTRLTDAMFKEFDFMIGGSGGAPAMVPKVFVSSVTNS